MIIISGDIFDISAIIDEYPRSSIERQLLTIMSQSSQKYRYDSLSQLKFELRMRKETVRSAKALNVSSLAFANFHKSKCNPEYWDRTQNGGLRLKEGADAAKAINDIYINGSKYATECATAMIIVFYKALLDIFKHDEFNKLFPKIYLMNWHSIDPLLKDIGLPHKVGDFLYGDRGYFKNPDVNPKTPEWQGENVIILPDGLYYGHGIGIKTAEGMIDSLNANRKTDATRSAYFLDAVSRPDFTKLADIYDRLRQTASLLWNAFPPAINISKIAHTSH